MYLIHSRVDLFKNLTTSRKVGVPGAFSPTCTSQLPGYIQDYEKYKAKGITEIYVITVNDAFVTK